MAEPTHNANHGRGHLPVAANASGGALVPIGPTSGSTVLAELRQADAPADDEINLLDYWRILLKRKWIVIGLALLVGLGGMVNTLLMVPMFRATATIQIESDTLNVVNVEGVTPAEYGDAQFYETQYQLLRSRSLAERVASLLQLGSDPAVNTAQPSPWALLSRAIFGRQEVPAATPTKAAAASVDDRKYSGVVQGGLIVEPIPNSRLVRLHFDHPNAQFTAKVVNAVAEAFIATNLERRFGASGYAKGYLEDLLAQLKQKLEDSERQLVAFAQKEQIISGAGSQPMITQDLTAVVSALSVAQSARFKAEARWKQAAAGSIPADILENSIVRQLREKRGELQSNYQEKLRVFKPEFPEMKQLQAQIAEIDLQMIAELKIVKASVKAEYDAALETEDMLRAQMGQVKTESLDLQSRSIDYTILEREVATNRELYGGLLQRYKEIGIAGGISTNNIQMVDSAQVPGGPYAPNLRRNVMNALMLGLFLGVLLALLLEYLDDTIKSPEDVEKRLRLVHLGVVPKLAKDDTPAQAALDLRSGFSEAYRSLRTALQFSTESGIPITLVVTSTMPGEGKTTTAKVLARNFALLGKRVLLIDADLRNPSLHRAFDLDNSMGLSNCLSGAAKPGQCIHRIEAAGLSVLPSGPLPPNPAELLAGPRMVSLLAQASERYDQIIIDAPPVLGLADAPILGNLAKGTLLVVESGRTRVGAGNAAIKRLLGARTRLLGAVLTKFDARQAGYGYGAGYGGYSYKGQYEYYGYGANAPKKLTERR